MTAADGWGARVLRNAGWNLAGRAWLVLLALVGVPITLHFLGPERYAVLVIAQGAMALVAVLDLGLSAAGMRHAAERRGAGDMAGLERVVGVSLVLYLVPAVVGSALTWLVAGPVTDLLGFEGALAGDMRAALLVAGIGFSATLPLQVFEWIPQALERMDLHARRTVVLATLTLAVQVWVLWRGGGPAAVMAVQVGGLGVGMLVFVPICRRLLPEVSLRPRWHGPTARAVASFGAWRTLSTFNSFAAMRLDRFLIKAWWAPAVVTAYAVPFALMSRVLTVTAEGATALFPAVASITGDRERVRDTFVTVTRTAWCALLPAFVVPLVLPEPLLAAWVGPEQAAASAPVLRLLSAAMLVMAVSTVPAIYCEGLGRPRVPALFSTVSAVLTVGLALVLIPRWGAGGAAAALLIQALVQVPVFVAVACRRVVGMSPWAWVSGALVRPWTAALGAGAVLWLLADAAAGGVLAFVAVAAGGIAAYAALLHLLGAVSAEDRAALRRLVAARGEGP